MKQNINFLSVATFLLVVLPSLAMAQSKEKVVEQGKSAKVTESTEDRNARMQWWREGKFGMFVHWGVYSTTGGLYRGQ